MIIINADDWGLHANATDAALRCHRAGRITSVSAMVFMDDSVRAAELARDAGIDAGLHLNLSTPFTGQCPDPLLIDCQRRVANFLTWSKWTVLLYNPSLRQDFRYTYRAQLREFERLYGAQPSHVDGHQHKHLCANMVLDDIIAAGERVRRNLTFRKGEKGVLNRIYRHHVDSILSRKYRLTDYFFALSQLQELPGIAELSTCGTMEIMSHPARPHDYAFLMSDGYEKNVLSYQTGTFAGPGTR